MNKQLMYKKLVVAATFVTLWSLPLAAFAQTRVVMPKNKYKVQDDVKLGAQAAAQVNNQFPILNDADATRYVERVGARLVSAIPAEFRQASFNYRFQVVNASDINAFALPGGPMYVNRGMIEAAKNEGEMAGVMAHEISHIALRHATAQATETQKYQIGSTIGQILGAVVGGGLGQVIGAGSQIGFGIGALKYSRSYETQADILGARIMADAGYDPRDLANMFRTIAGERSGGGGPQWMSSHPDPGNRFEKINQEASSLRVSNNPIKITRDFERVKARLKAMPRARTMAEIEKGRGGQGGQTNPTANGRYSQSVEYPSGRVQSYSGINSVRFNVPSNWREFAGGNEALFAPEGAYGDQGITHGAMVGLFTGENSVLTRDAEAYVRSILDNNTYLARRGGYVNTWMNGRRATSIVLAGRSTVTNRNEIVTVYASLLNTGELFYITTVVPENESSSYSQAFRNMISSVRFSDQ